MYSDTPLVIPSAVPTNVIPDDYQVNVEDHLLKRAPDLQPRMRDCAYRRTETFISITFGSKAG